MAPENPRIIESIRRAGVNATSTLGYTINRPGWVEEAAEVGADGVIVGTAKCCQRSGRGDEKCRK